MTTLSVVAPNAQLEDVDLSAYTNLTTVTVSPSKGYKSIKLPAGIVNFTSVCSNAQSIGPVDLDLTAYTNLETVDVGGTSWGSGSKALVSLNCKGLAKLKLIRAAFASAKTINISGCCRGMSEHRLPREQIFLSIRGAQRLSLARRSSTMR